jgi:hypothetical protein
MAPKEPMGALLFSPRGTSWPALSSTAALAAAWSGANRGTEFVVGFARSGMRRLTRCPRGAAEGGAARDPRSIALEVAGPG